MQNYEYNAQKTWKTNSKYAKVNRRRLENEFDPEKQKY